MTAINYNFSGRLNDSKQTCKLILKEKLKDANAYVMVFVKYDFGGSNSQYPRSPFLKIETGVFFDETHTWSNGVVEQLEATRNVTIPIGLDPKILRSTTDSGIRCFEVSLGDYYINRDKNEHTVKIKWIAELTQEDIWSIVTKAI